MNSIEPAFFTIEAARDYSGLSRSKIYIELGAGRLVARKAGKRTLISRRSLDGLMAALPAATFKKAAA